MRPTRKTQVFSTSSILVGLLVIPLVVFLVIFLIQPTAFSSSSSSSPSSSLETTGNEAAGNTSSSSSSSTSYSVALSREETWQPQPPAQAPLFTFSNYQRGAPAPAPQIFAVDDDEGANKTVFMRSSSQLDRLEASLGRARSSIREAAKVRNKTSTHQDPDYVPRGPIYRNPNAFHRSIYSSEGRFIHEMEKGNMYRTRDPDKALVYFLPFSVVRMVQYLYMPNSNDRHGMKLAIIDYVNLIAQKHPFWNRSLGADHFMLSCHDWAPFTTSFVPLLFHKSIRVLCNANTSEGFNPSKDASFPEINLKTSEMSGLGGQSPSTRSTLAFFAGRLHGHIRSLLLNEWKGKDQDVQVYDQLPRGVSYEKMLKGSKFCLCPSGYEVASPRVVEAIYAECIPVLISDGYIPPFSDVLDWKSFSVQVPVKNISDIKNILMSISSRQYLRMQRRVKQVQRHFLVNGPPKRYDVFHMIVHSIWLRRLNIRIQDLLT